MLPALAPGTRLAHKAAGARAMHDTQARRLHGLGLTRRRTSVAPRRRAQPTKAIGGVEAALAGVSDAAVMQAIGFGLAAVWVGLQLMLEQVGLPPWRGAARLWHALPRPAVATARAPTTQHKPALPARPPATAAAGSRRAAAAQRERLLQLRGHWAHALHLHPLERP